MIIKILFFLFALAIFIGLIRLIKSSDKVAKEMFTPKIIPYVDEVEETKKTSNKGRKIS